VNPVALSARRFERVFFLRRWPLLSALCGGGSVFDGAALIRRRLS
jgi:hypothetical protein